MKEIKILCNVKACKFNKNGECCAEEMVFVARLEEFSGRGEPDYSLIVFCCGKYEGKYE